MATDLHVTSPMMRGPIALSVQKRLTALGYGPGTIDGIYGPTTAAAVSAFQIDQKLPVDGVVGPQTLAALEAAIVPPNGGGAAARATSALGKMALDQARQHIGLKENPPGSNRTMFGQWYGIDGVPWCSIFVSYCFAEGAGYIIAKGFNGAGVRADKGCAYVPTTAAWLRASGAWVGRTEPLPGDIAIFNWDGGAPDHIGIVEQNLGGGEFVAVEGNTALHNDSNGGEVMRRSRFLTQVDGFGRLILNLNSAQLRA